MLLVCVFKHTQTSQVVLPLSTHETEGKELNSSEVLIPQTPQEALSRVEDLAHRAPQRRGGSRTGDATAWAGTTTGSVCMPPLHANPRQKDKSDARASQRSAAPGGQCPSCCWPCTKPTPCERAGLRDRPATDRPGHIPFLPPTYI